MSERERGRLRLGGLLVVVASLAVVVFLSLAGSALAATSVTCTDSASDQVLLQTAINGGGTVLVHGHCLGNWDVANNVTLTGVGGAILDGGAVSSVLVVEPFVTVTINSLTIENGADDVGGGIIALDDSTVNVNNSTITNNIAFEGGGIFAEFFAFVNLTGTTVSHNTADVGGGIFLGAALLTATNSTIASNTASEGGGILSEVSDIALSGTHVSWNTAFDEAGGIGYFDGGTSGQITAPPAGSAKLKFPRPPILRSHPQAAGAAPVRGAAAPVLGSGLTLTSSTVDHNTGQFDAGGILNVAEGSDSPVTLISSTIAYNNAPAISGPPGQVGGGGIYNAGDNGFLASVTASKSAIRGNLARTSNGGAILNAASGGSALVSLVSTSVSSANGTANPNQAKFGGGIYNSGDGADVTLGKGASVNHNIASVTGGGIYNECNGTITIAGGLVLLNNPNNIVNDLTNCDD